MTRTDPLPRADATPAWAALQARRQPLDVNAAFAADAQRFERLSQAAPLEAPLLFADFSKTWLDAPTEALLLDLARQTGIEAQRDAMFAGLRINRSEHRAALHTLLRTPRGAALPVAPAAADDDATPAIDLPAAHTQVLATRQAMLDLAEQVRANPAITDVVHIGIGGSDLGPRMVVRALLSAGADARQRLHFVANVDGHELAAVLRQCQPQHTLFLIASKTFTTLETLLNAQSAKAWWLAAPGSPGAARLAQHFVGLTSNQPAARAFGIDTVLGFEDWVGGRYSLWSAIGLPIAIAIGAAGFQDLLAGAHAMDTHFRTAPLARNLPVRLGLLDLWQRSVMGLGSRCIAPYHAGLRELVPHLQQLEMESNGKSVDQHGQPLGLPTAPVIWGEPGTNGQHAFFQMLHQGPQAVPVEFIAVAEPAHPLDAAHHQQLLANALAQARALMLGHASANPHPHCPGNRPSTFLLLPRLDAQSLGALVALYEHRVFVQGAAWGLNSFDQWGVELGKQIASDIAPRLHGDGAADGLDASTAGLLQRLRVNNR